MVYYCLTTLKPSCIHFWTSKIFKHHNPPMSDESLNIWDPEEGNFGRTPNNRFPSFDGCSHWSHTTNCGGHRPPKKVLNWHEIKMLMLKTTIGHSIHIKNIQLVLYGVLHSSCEAYTMHLWAYCNDGLSWRSNPFQEDSALFLVIPPPWPLVLLSTKQRFTQDPRSN